MILKRVLKIKKNISTQRASFNRDSGKQKTGKSPSGLCANLLEYFYLSEGCASAKVSSRKNIRKN